MPESIILIGAPRTGKSTIGRLLAAELGLPFVDLDASNPQVFATAGAGDEVLQQRWNEGFASYYRFLKPFEAAALERGLAEHTASIVEVPATQAVYEDAELLRRVRLALEPFPLVVRLAPSPDVEHSLRVIEERSRVVYDGHELNEHFVRHPANAALATITVYTGEQTPEQTEQFVFDQLDPADPTVVLIGPMSSGKSTIGRLLAQRLGRPEVALDQLRWQYYGEIGFDEARQREIGAAEGFAGVYRYWKPFELHAAERVLAEHAGSVIHFGAGHSVFYEPEHTSRIRAALAPFRNVVLLLPSPDAEQAVKILRERNAFRIDGVELNRYLVAHPSMPALATHTLFTDGKTPAETRDELLALKRQAEETKPPEGG